MPNIVVRDLRGGRNGIDSPLIVPETQCVDALNVDWFTSPLGRKRGGSEEVDTTGGTAFFDSIMSLFWHSAVEDTVDGGIWAIDNAVPPLVKNNRIGTWANEPLDDPITSPPQHVAATSFNAKLFMAYGSGLNRLHVHDGLLDRIRRVGLAAPGIPVITNEGGGTYAATERFYRVRVIRVVAGAIVARSEPSAAVAFTPSGAGAGARITLGTVPSEHETHWEVDVSLDEEVWFALHAYEYDIAGIGGHAAIVIGTTFIDDEDFAGSPTVAADYLTLDIAQNIGEFTLPPAAKFVVNDGNRLLMAGSYITGQPTSRVWWTPVLGSADMGDDERIINTDTIKGYLDINEKNGGGITGMASAKYGIIYVFKLEQIWKLTPTGIAAAPYRALKISDTLGCLYHKTILSAEDASGNPIVGFLSLRGPGRISLDGGVLMMGRDMDDIWFGLNNYPDMVNVNAATMIAHGIYYADLHQIWWFVALNVEDSPRLKMMQDVRHATRQDQYGIRGGWARHLGLSCRAVCSVMAPDEVGSKRFVPYVGTREPV